MATPANPFFFESPTDRWSFTDRDDLLPSLLQLMTEPGRRVLLYGRRRMGKTSLILRAAARSRLPFVYCDISTAASLGELAQKLLQASPRETGLGLAQLLELAGKRLKSVGLTAGRLTLTGELRPDEGQATLESVLGLLNERAAARDEVWTVCLDEFQELRALGGPRIDWPLRGLLQHHRHLTYLFTGSDHRIVGWMTDPTAPFFKQLHQIEVGPIPADHLIRWLEQRARQGGLAAFPQSEAIVRQAGPCTGDIVRLAKSVFSLAASGASGDLVGTAFDAIALGELQTELLNHWRSLPPNQRGMLRAIAAGEPPTAARTLRTYGLRATSTASTAIAGLVDRQFLARTEAGLIFDNPFFRRWVEYHAAR